MIVAGMITLVGYARLSALCDPTLPCPDLPIQEMVRTWVWATGLLAITAFALGARAAGLALCGALLGAVIGESVGGELAQRPAFGAAMGASLGVCVAALVGFLRWRSRGAVSRWGVPWLLRAAGVAVLIVGIVAARPVPGLIAPNGASCRAPSFGELCHRHLIAGLIVGDAAFIGVLLVLAARGTGRPGRTLRPMLTGQPSEGSATVT